MDMKYRFVMLPTIINATKKTNDWPKEKDGYRKYVYDVSIEQKWGHGIDDPFTLCAWKLPNKCEINNGTKDLVTIKVEND